MNWIVRLHTCFLSMVIFTLKHQSWITVIYEEGLSWKFQVPGQSVSSGAAAGRDAGPRGTAGLGRRSSRRAFEITSCNICDELQLIISRSVMVKKRRERGWHWEWQGWGKCFLDGERALFGGSDDRYEKGSKSNGANFRRAAVSVRKSIVRLILQ